MNTTKICNFRNCPKHPSLSLPINPCRAFKNLETGHWHDEMTASKLIGRYFYDGKIRDIQEILNIEYENACCEWKMGQAVHEEIRGLNAKVVNKPTPKVENRVSEIEEAIDWWKRNKGRKNYLIKRISVLGDNIHSLMLLRRKFAVKGTIDEQIEKIRMERTALQFEQSDIDKKFAKYRHLIIEDENWADKWITKRASRDVEKVLLYTSPDGDLFEINKNGITKNMEYIYIPELHNQREECLSFAHRSLQIHRSAWSETTLPAEFIGKPIKHSGKKNANGRRIRARADNKKYSTFCLDVWRHLKKAGINTDEILVDPTLKEQYETKVKSKIIDIDG